MCSVLLCLHLQQPVSGSEEGGIQVMRYTDNFFMLCFVCLQLVAEQGNTSPWLGSIAMSPWVIRCCTKVSFKSKFSFSCSYIYCQWPSQESKVQVSPCQLTSQQFGSVVDKVITFQQHSSNFRDQASYTLDNKTESNGHTSSPAEDETDTVF